MLQTNRLIEMGAAALRSKGWRDAPKDFDRLRESRGVTIDDACSTGSISAALRDVARREVSKPPEVHRRIRAG
jgi:hypothetical protein